MKIVLDLIDKQFKANEDLIVYSLNDGKYKVISKTQFLKDTSLQLIDLQQQVDELNSKLDVFKTKVNEKLENHHKVLGILTKQGEQE